VDDEQNCAPVKAPIDLDHALLLKVAANGVETPDHRAVLKNMGCDLAQGFGFARPGDAAHLAKF
jgi:EAL domain-containing protein (putative c-di-GMP-specific phosphodiesterase class I)